MNEDHFFSYKCESPSTTILKASPSGFHRKDLYVVLKYMKEYVPLLNKKEKGEMWETSA